MPYYLFQVYIQLDINEVKNNLDVGQLVHRCIHFVSSGWKVGLLGSSRDHIVSLFCLGKESKLWQTGCSLRFSAFSEYKRSAPANYVHCSPVKNYFNIKNIHSKVHTNMDPSYV